jgi:hypothetical protein
MLLCCYMAVHGANGARQPLSLAFIVLSLLLLLLRIYVHECVCTCVQR